MRSKRFLFRFLTVSFKRYISSLCKFYYTKNAKNTLYRTCKRYYNEEIPFFKIFNSPLDPQIRGLFSVFPTVVKQLPDSNYNLNQKHSTTMPVLWSLYLVNEVYNLSR